MALEVEIDDIASHDPDLSQAMLTNTKRYHTMFTEVVQELLPIYKDKDVRSCTL